MLISASPPFEQAKGSHTCFIVTDKALRTVSGKEGKTGVWQQTNILLKAPSSRSLQIGAGAISQWTKPLAEMLVGAMIIPLPVKPHTEPGKVP